MQKKAQIDVTVTVTQTYSEQKNAFGKTIKSTKELLTDEGKILITTDSKNKLTTVVGDIMFGNMDYCEINSSANPQKNDNPPYSNMKQALLKKYDMSGDVLCKAIAEYKLIEKMNEVGAQAVFMPNYCWTYHYDDMLSDDKKSNEKCDDTILKKAEKTIITLKITATAVNFVKEKD